MVCKLAMLTRKPAKLGGLATDNMALMPMSRRPRSGTNNGSTGIRESVRKL
jgi:hypothetical protein